MKFKRKKKDKKMIHLRLKKRQFEVTKDTIIIVNIFNVTVWYITICHYTYVITYHLTRLLHHTVLSCLGALKVTDIPGMWVWKS